MKNYKILVLGSNGFIGNHTANYFHGMGHIVLGCDLRETGTNPYEFQKIEVDKYDLGELFSSCQFDFCVNAAGNGDVNKSIVAPSEDFESNVSFTLKILEAIRKFNSSCKYLHISSAAVYGNPEKLPMSETDSLNPISPYGWHKLISENLCKEYFCLYNIQSAVIRPFSVYGEGLKKQLLWDVFNKVRDNDDIIELWGSGEETRDFIHVDDLVKSIELIILNAPMQAEVYNVASGEMTSISQIVERLLEKLEKKNKVSFNGITRNGIPLKWLSDTSRINKLGFAPKVNLEQGLSSLSEWLKNLK